MWIVWLIVGALFGALLGEGAGALAGLSLAWLWWRTQQQGRQIVALQEAVAALRGTAQPAGPAGVPLTVPPPAEPAEALAAPAIAAAAVPDTPAVEPAPAPPEPPTRPPGPRVLLAAKDWLFGGNTIVKVGIGLLFVGLAFLAKYASEQVEVPVALRLAGICMVALVLLGLGWRLRERRAAYAQVLQGGSVAVLYLTLFAAFRFYGLLPMAPVFALMAVVAALAAALAVLQNAPALAIIGALGGFATPLLLSQGGGSHIALFAYYAVLNLGIAAVAWHRTWRRLVWVGFVCTFLVATTWGVLQYQPSHYASSQAFLVFFFLLFNAILLMPARHPEALAGERWVNGSLLFGLPTITFVLQHGLVREVPYGSALSALALAAFYVAMATRLRRHAALAVTFDASLAIAMVFVSLVIPFALDARSTAGAWALEGAGLVWLGWRQRRGLPRAFGYTLLFLAGLSMQWAIDRYGQPHTVFNAYCFNALMAAAAALAAAFHVHRGVRSTGAQQEALAEPLLIGWALLWAVGGAALQIEVFVAPGGRFAAWLAVLGGLAVVLTLLSHRLDWPRAAWPPIALAPLLLAFALAQGVDLADPLAGGGAGAWPIALAAHAVVLWRAAGRWPTAVATAVHALGLLVVAALGALLGRTLTGGWGDAGSAWPWLGWAVVPAALLFALPHASVARRWPVREAPAAYQAWAGGVLTTGLLLWTVLANLDSDGSAHPLPYLPLLNPLDLGIAGVLVAAWHWGRSAPARAGLGRAADRAVPAAIGVAAFVWLNAMLVRAFHHHGGVPFQLDAWAQSLAVQTGISLLWTATAWALMWTAARRAQRLPWMVGAGLLAAVVLKLLLVDLSGSGTLTRIVSFIGVGVLMLVIGFVAPWPGKEASRAAR